MELESVTNRWEQIEEHTKLPLKDQIFIKFLFTQCLCSANL